MKTNSSNYSDTSKILSDNLIFSDILPSHEKYFAHTHLKKPKESLKDHVELVVDYLEKFINSNGLDKILDQLLGQISNSNGNLLKEIFLNTSFFHDFGKINENFQLEKMNETSFQKVSNGISSTHSSLGAYIFISYYLDKIEKLNLEEDFVEIIFAFILSFPILKHHSKKLDIDFGKFENLDIDLIFKYFDEYKFPSQVSENYKNTKSFQNIIQCLKNSFYEEEYFQDPFSLFVLVKLNYSLLTSSDYIATSDYMSEQNEKEKNFGVLTKERKTELISNFKNNSKYPHNKNIYLENEIEKFKNLDFESIKEISNSNLNLLRMKLASEVIINIRINLNKNLFYIEAPTGGGKTNLSILALVELLENDLEDKIKRVFYVFPFTTLITQTVEVLKNTLKLNENELIELHSKTGFKIKNESKDIYEKEEEKDGLYDIEKLNYIDNLFSNFPFILLSHVKFFDILKSNKKEINYLFQKLANSVVILDELQAFNPEHWDKLNYFIQNFADKLNIKFILMSATLPKIGNLFLTENSNDKFVYLNSKKNEFFTNPNFKERVKFDFTLLEEEIDLNKLKEQILEKSNDYFNQKKKVFCIVELITKKTASELHALFLEEKFFDKVILLSGTILESRRKEIISYIKENQNKELKILLITTQVVEAGVDIDMDIGFKNISIVDSDEQLAGRINRNASKKNSVLYLFKLDEPNKIYGKDQRYKFLKKSENKELYKEILGTKNFDLLYNEIMNEIKKLNQSKLKENFNTYLNYFRNLEFSKIDSEFQLIDSATISIFIPLDIPIQNPNTNSKNFSETEIKFLEERNILGEKISGEKVWEIYKNLIQNKREDFLNKKEKDFVKDKIEMKKIQSILNQFTINIFKHANLLKEITLFGYEEFGYFYLETFEEIYSYQNGFVIDFEGSNIL